MSQIKSNESICSHQSTLTGLFSGKSCSAWRNPARACMYYENYRLPQSCSLWPNKDILVQNLHEKAATALLLIHLFQASMIRIHLAAASRVQQMYERDEAEFYTQD